MSEATVQDFSEHAAWVQKLEDELVDLKTQVKEKRDELKKAIEQYVSMGLQEKGSAQDE